MPGKKGEKGNRGQRGEAGLKGLLGAKGLVGTTGPSVRKKIFFVRFNIFRVKSYKMRTFFHMEVVTLKYDLVHSFRVTKAFQEMLAQ